MKPEGILTFWQIYTNAVPQMLFNWPIHSRRSLMIFWDPKESFKALLVSKTTGSQAEEWGVIFVGISQKNSIAE